MLHVIASGNITRDAVLKQVGDTEVCSFGIACNRKVKGEEKVQFLDLNIWGKRGASLQPHLVKGKKVFVAGELETREHDGKTYLQCRVSELDFGGGGGSSQGGTAADTAGSGGAGGSDGADDIPF